MNDRPTKSLDIDYEIRAFDLERAMPWSVAELQAVRAAALALVKSHCPFDLPNGTTVSLVDGRLFWALLCALDRERD